MRMIGILALAPIASFAGATSSGPPIARKLPIVIPPKALEVTGSPKEVELGPIYAPPFACTEHYYGQLPMAGDALGTDCWILGGVQPQSGFARPFRTDGHSNEDWYGWHADVLSPVEGKVIGVFTNPVDNVPGTMGKPPAGMIQLLRADGVAIVIAHIADPRVKVGDEVRKGDVIGRVGNNGMARAPHIHIGAYRFRTGEALQIRWDLRAMAKLEKDY